MTEKLQPTKTRTKQKPDMTNKIDLTDKNLADSKHADARKRRRLARLCGPSFIKHLRRRRNEPVEMQQGLRRSCVTSHEKKEEKS
jgi:hypothetical protein